MPSLIIQYGEPRTASTLQFQTLCAIALVLNEADPSRVDCVFRSRDDVDTDPNGFVSNPNGLRVVKTHTVPSAGFPKDAWLFTSEIDHEVSFDDPWQDAAKRMSQKLGHDVKYTQVLSRLTGRGSGIVTEYKAIFGLSDPQVEEVVTYLRSWDVLRMCCGAQMNDAYRAELISNLRPNSSETSQSEYPACDMYRIQAVERQAVQTRVFKLASKGGFGSRYLRGTSSLESDEGYDLNGQYCAWYNRQVACQELPFNQLPENPGCDGEKFPRASRVFARPQPPRGRKRKPGRSSMGMHGDEGSDGGPKQLRMHHIPDCQMCGVDWCARSATARHHLRPQRWHARRGRRAHQRQLWQPDGHEALLRPAARPLRRHENVPSSQPKQLATSSSRLPGSPGHRQGREWDLREARELVRARRFDERAQVLRRPAGALVP